MPAFIRALADCTPELCGAAGGKAIGLGALIRQGVRVPDGFAVTTEAYLATVRPVLSTIEQITEAESGADSATSEKLRGLIESLEVPTDVIEAITTAYLAIDPTGEALVAVRSSATAEDLADASFAGQQDTYLGIRGAEEVVRHVVRCWGSLFTPQAIGYRSQFSLRVDGLAMAVVVQSLIQAEAAGVMMSLDPMNGDRSTVFISAAHGLGEGVVKGDVESDSIWVDKTSLSVTRQRLVQQVNAHRYDETSSRTEFFALTPDLRGAPALSAGEAVELAKVAVTMEQAQGCPQDLEWAIGRDTSGARNVYLLQSRPETVWTHRSGIGDRPPALHGASHPQTTWTTTNVGESVPGIPTPLGWSMWSVAGEIAMRSAFHAIGALSRSELEMPDVHENRLLGIFYGRAALNVSLVCDWVERVPGTDPVAMSEQTFSARPKDYARRSQRRYYPRVAAKAGLPLVRVKSMVLDDRADAAQFRGRALAELAYADEARTRVLLDEALAMHLRCLSTQTLLTMAVCQPITDRLLTLASSVGFSGEELMAGYGGHDETGAVVDMWACSRDRLGLDTFLARHGYHTWQEGELSARSWREDPTPVRSLIDRYRALPEDDDPSIAERDRMARREELERRFLATLPRWKRPVGRLLLRLARNFVPLRGIAKGSFVQSLDVVRAASRRLGAHLQESGVLAARDDIFYLTLPELRAAMPADVRHVVAARRAERASYESLEMPTVWTGVPEPTQAALQAGEDTIVGTGASPGVVEGRARVVTQPGQAHVEDGEILVARDTDPSWASLMFLSSGLIADIGGVMSHTAIVAREMSLPCVVNTGHASKTLTTGDLIRLNGSLGTIEVLERAVHRSSD